MADEPHTSASGARVLRVRLDGRLDGRFDAVIGQLAERYEQLPQRRLVVIGEPGAGKTVLATLLTLGLLGARQPGGRVPVLLPVSTWDPVREPLDDWIVRTLAVPYYSGRQEIPRALLAHGLLLPVLDGLDEIPESARRGAIRGINHAIGGERPVVVTCRAVEYEELIRGGAPTLRQAPVVEVTPVPPRDVIGYLRDVDWPEGGSGWDGVFARLRAEPSGPLAEALSTPLMVTTARLVYQRGGGDPAELLDRERFDCRYAVEDHLTHRVVDATYGSDPGVPEGAPAGEPWGAERARRWLTFLARYLHDHRERDLAWWLVSGRVLPVWAGPVLAFGLGLLLAVGAVVWTAATRGFGQALSSNDVLVPMYIGGAFALISCLIWYAAGTRPPGRLSFSLRGSAGRLRRGFRLGVLLGAAAVVPVTAGICVFRVLTRTPGPGSLQAAAEVSESLMACATLSLVVGVALAAHNWLNAPPSRATQASPMKSYAQDRRSALAGASVGGLVVGAAGLLGLHAGQLAGDLVFRALTDWPGLPGTGDVSDSGALKWRQDNEALGLDSHGWGMPFVLPGVAFALFILMTRAWPRFLLAKVWLAASGQLPWRLFAFLGDARRREIVKQSNSTYQFRHIRLQEALAGEPAYAGGSTSARPGVTGGVRRRLVLSAGAAAVLGGGVALIGRHEDQGEVLYWDPDEVPMTAVVFRPNSDEVVWGAEDGRLWRGHLRWNRSLLGRVRLTASEEDDVIDRGVTGLAFRPDGGVLAVGRRDQLKLWNTHGKSEWRTIGRAGMATSGLAFGDGYLSGYANHGPFHTLLRIDEEGQPKEIDIGGGDPYLVASGWLRGNSLVLVGKDGQVRLHAAPTFAKGPGVPLMGAPQGEDLLNSELVVSPHDDCLHLNALASGLPEHSGLWRPDPRDGKWHKTGHVPSPSSVAFHPRKPFLALSRTFPSEEWYGDGTIELWRTDGTPSHWKSLYGHMSEVHSMSFNSNGTKLASASYDGTVRLWNIGHLP
ncbi:NACHT domain-containing protein [Streptomyces sp. NPDC050988]|uniref:WD40 repeat domain-containing protein n=1 Tax=Streptomyces sp. NPDC050988 TaxID=3365637 RepID=UPI00379258A6